MASTTWAQNASPIEMRLFVGIEIPLDIKQRMSGFLGHLKTSPKGWVDPHDYHLTLLFIGETDQRQCELIQDRLRNLSFHSFRLELLRPEFFNRRVMYYSLAPSEDLKQLKAMVDKTYPEWVRSDSVPFLPHVTIKRWQRYEFEDLNQRLRQTSFQPLLFMVNGISLFKSEKDSLGHKYHILRTNFF